MLGFLFGYALGLSSDGSTETTQPKATPGDVYVNGEAIQRVQNPLEVKTACAGWHNFWKEDKQRFDSGTTFLSLFRGLHPNDAEEYEILRITRVMSQSNSSASFWFEFIEKNKLAPNS
jgi:hypothetical protein